MFLVCSFTVLMGFSLYFPGFDFVVVHPFSIFYWEWLSLVTIACVVCVVFVGIVWNN